MNKPGFIRRTEFDKALQFRERFGADLPEGDDIRILFQIYRDLIRQTDLVMVDSGVAAACAQCASVKGSCCFAGMDESYGALSLYVNLLMGSEFSAEVESTSGCRYVGKEGCRLKARHSFCLNYFCPELKDSLGEKQVERLQRIVGEQLAAGWEIERALAKWMANA